MHLRLKSVLATLVTTGMMAGILGIAQVAQAATTPPPFEPDPNARGCLTFYDANGNVITGGSITDSPIAAYALANGPSRPGDTSGTLYAAQPAPGVPSQNWLTQQLSAGNDFPSSDPATPANLRNSPNPLYIGQSGDASVSDILGGLPPAGNADDNQYQIRFITNGISSGTDTLWWRADIQVTGNTWTQTWCPPAAAPVSTTTSLTASPPSPQTVGTTVNLTASVTPTAAVGSVQFQDNGANLGPAVSVTAGTATTSTNSLTVGTHSLTAAFTPTDPTAFTSSTSPPVSYVITAAAKSTDLSITKTGPATATTGGALSYSLTAMNNGPDAATGVVVTDTLPAGVTFVPAGSTASCSASGATVTCNVGSLASGATSAITINATAPGTPGSITNNASITGNEPDPNAANNSASATTTVTASTDLSITKTGPSSVTASSSYSYTLTAKNGGPSGATGVVVTDTLPTGVTFVSATPSTCTNASGTVTCTIGSLASGASSTITLNVTAPANPGSITNTAKITGNEPDPNAANNSASATTTVTASTDLSITKTGPSSVTASSSYSYTLTAKNGGPSGATGVVVTDTLPTGVTFVSATPAGICTGTTTVTCTIGSLASGASSTITLNVTAPANPGSITNTAKITGNESDPNTANNSASASTTVVASTDLSITKTGPATATTGTSFTYTLAVKNSGPSAATGVVVTDTLPAGVTFVSATPSTCTNASGTVTCTIGSLASGATATITITVTPTSVGTITNTAVVKGNEPDPNAANNSASATTTVQTATLQADVSITKTGPATATVTAPITYSLTVKNNGPNGATNVVATDTLPAGVTFVSVTSSQGSCTQASGTVTCNLGSLASGATATITIVVNAPASPATITNTAKVKANETDPNANNNSASATTQVVAAQAGTADVSIAKYAFPEDIFGNPPFEVNHAFWYILVVHNAGPSTATGVVVTDQLPAGLTYTFSWSTMGSCSQAAGQVTCNIGTMAKNQTAFVAIRVIPTRTGSITNTGTVKANQTDPNPANNSSKLTINISK